MQWAFNHNRTGIVIITSTVGITFLQGSGSCLVELVRVTIAHHHTSIMENYKYNQPMT